MLFDSLSPAARRRWRATGSMSFVAACFLFLKADDCDHKTVDDPDVPVASVDMNFDTLRLAPGASATVEASPFSSDNKYIEGRSATWAAGSPAVATVTPTRGYDATVTAVAAGTGTVTATISGVSAKVTVVVAVPTIAVARVSVLATANARPLDTLSITATAFDANNNTLTGRVFDWRVADPTVATVIPRADGSASFVALKVGTTAYTVTSEGKSATGTLTVAGAPVPARIRSTPDTIRLAPGQTTSVTIGAYDRAGGALPDSVVRVAIADSLVAAFVPDTTKSAAGRAAIRITAFKVGTTTIRASNSTTSLDIPVIVAIPPAARVTIAPKTATVVVNHTQTFTATAADASGAAYKGTIAFSAVGTGTSITPAGVLTATQPGNVLVIATAGTLADTARVTVIGIDSVRITPRPAIALTVGATASATARAYAGGNLVGDATFTWTSSNSAVATVVPSNNVAVVTGKAAGTATIVATSSGKSDTVTVTVTAVPANTLALHPQNPISIKRLANGGTETFPESFYVGDHEATGDKSIQAFGTYNLSALPTNATITQALMTVQIYPTETVGSPFALGALVAEPATSYTPNEGAVSSSAVTILSSATPTTQTVDVTSLVRAARTAGAQSLVLRFRFTSLGNNNAQIDYLQFSPDPIAVSYTVPGSVRATSH